MFKDDILEKIICHRNMSGFCIDAQTEIINMMEDVLREVEEGNPYATVSELFDQ